MIEKKLAEVSPGEAGTYATNLAALTADLSGLDTEYKDGLANCSNKDLVTSHEAFGYLAGRYGMTQVGITGLSPEQEPDAATLARVAQSSGPTTSVRSTTRRWSARDREDRRRRDRKWRPPSSTRSKG